MLVLIKTENNVDFLIKIMLYLESEGRDLSLSIDYGNVCLD